MLYLIRHGETDRNRAQVLQGRSNAPLNAKGQAQASAAGAFFRANGIHFSRVWSSPLDRAVETARLAAGTEVPLQTDPALLEMDYGPYEGVSLENMPKELITFFQDFVHNPAPEGMESLSHVTARLGAFLESISEAASEGDVLLSTHAIAMKGALEYLTPDADGYYWPHYIGNCSVYRVPCEHGSYGIPEEFYTAKKS